MDKLDLELPSTPKTTGLRQSNVNTKGGPRTRIVYSRPVEINQVQVFNKHKVVERIARNTVVIISSFYRCKHPEAKNLFDQYIDSVIGAQKDSLETQHKELSKAVKQAESKGYQFDVHGSPATIDIMISNPHVQKVANLLIQVDENIDMLSKLGVIGLINEDVRSQQETYALYSIDYIDKALSLLLQRLSSEFSFKPNRSTSQKNTKGVDFAKIKLFLKGLVDERMSPSTSVE